MVEEHLKSGLPLWFCWVCENPLCHNERPHTPEQDEVRTEPCFGMVRGDHPGGVAVEAAIRGGHVQLNGARVKPSRELKVGDRLSIARGVERFEIEVRGLSEKRGPAKVAAEQAAEQDKPDYVIDYEFCKGCGLCAYECPANAIDLIQEGK